MPLFDKPFGDLDEAHLARLVADGEAESKTIDFKRDLVGQSDGDKKEFLYDVSSFANTIGGDLVFGMDERQGVATELVGLDGLNADIEIQRLLQIARDGIRPPIAGLNARAIQLANGRTALVVRIPRSWNPPHQVTYQKAFRFYARDTNTKYHIEVDELRSAFTGSTAIADRLRSYRTARSSSSTWFRFRRSLRAGLSPYRRLKLILTGSPPIWTEPRNTSASPSTASWRRPTAMLRRRRSGHIPLCPGWALWRQSRRFQSGARSPSSRDGSSITRTTTSGR